MDILIHTESNQSTSWYLAGGCLKRTRLFGLQLSRPCSATLGNSDLLTPVNNHEGPSHGPKRGAQQHQDKLNIIEIYQSTWEYVSLEVLGWWLQHATSINNHHQSVETVGAPHLAMEMIRSSHGPRVDPGPTRHLKMHRSWVDRQPPGPDSGLAPCKGITKAQTQVPETMTHHELRWPQFGKLSVESVWPWMFRWRAWNEAKME